MRLLTIHLSFCPSPVLLLVANSGNTCTQPKMFPTLISWKAMAAGSFSHVQIWRRDPSYPRFQVLWWAPGRTSPQEKLHSRLGAWFWTVIAVAMGDAHSARHNTSLGIALPTPSHHVNPLHAGSGFLCIDTSEICVHLLNPQLEP